MLAPLILYRRAEVIITSHYFADYDISDLLEVDVGKCVAGADDHEELQQVSYDICVTYDIVIVC